MERYEQLLGDSENRMNTVLKNNEEFQLIMKKYAEKFPKEPLGKLIFRMEESEKKLVINLVMGNLFPIIDEFFAESR